MHRSKNKRNYCQINLYTLAFYVHIYFCRMSAVTLAMHLFDKIFSNRVSNDLTIGLSLWKWINFWFSIRYFKMYSSFLLQNKWKWDKWAVSKIKQKHTSLLSGYCNEYNRAENIIISKLQASIFIFDVDNYHSFCLNHLYYSCRRINWIFLLPLLVHS